MIAAYRYRPSMNDSNGLIRQYTLLSIAQSYGLDSWR